MKTKHIKLFECPKLHAHLSEGACRAMQQRSLRTYFRHFYEEIDLTSVDLNDILVMAACAHCQRSAFRIPVDEIMTNCVHDLCMLQAADYWELDKLEAEEELPIEVKELVDSYNLEVKETHDRDPKIP